MLVHLTGSAAWRKSVSPMVIRDKNRTSYSTNLGHFLINEEAVTGQRFRHLKVLYAPRLWDPISTNVEA